MFPTEAVPEQIGGYKVVRRLAGTGSVEVYLGRKDGPRGFHQDVELKLLPDTSEGNERFAEELTREAAICARLNHPAVVRMFDFFEHQGKIVLALEHVEATSLERLLQDLAEKGERLEDSAVFYIGQQVAGALAHAHAAADEQGIATPIIHRNLSPENILVATDGQVRLTGFGLGKILGRTPNTALGTIKGTPGYMAPEQRRGEPVTTKADVCGLSLLLWSLLLGRRPPTDGSWPAGLGSLRKDLPPEIASAVDAGLDPFPGTRKITCAEIERRFSEVVHERGKSQLKERISTLLMEEIEAFPDPTLPPPPAPLEAPRNPFEGVRFGPPAAVLVPKPPREEPAPISVIAPRPRGMSELDWRQSIPDVDSLDRFFVDPNPPESSRSPDLPPSLPEVPALPATPPAPVAAIPPPRPPMRATPPAPIAAPAPAITPRPTGIAPLRFGAPPPVIRFGPPPEESEPLVTPPAVAVIAAPPIAAPAIAPAPIAPAPIAAPPIAPAPIVAVAASAPVAPSVDRPSSPPPRYGRAPSPSLLRLPRALSASDAIAVSAVTATLVVIVAFFVWSRVHKDTPAPVATQVEKLSPPAATAEVAAPVPSAKPSAAATAAPETPNVAALSAGYGYLSVVTPAIADVYLSGKLAGPANQALQVRCGRWFVRLATPGETRYPEWVSRGETVDVTCQGATRVTMSPTPNAAPNQSPRGNR